MGYHKCKHPDASPVQVNLMTGSTKRVLETCNIARIRPCGADGKFWEPRP